MTCKVSLFLHATKIFPTNFISFPVKMVLLAYFHIEKGTWPETNRSSQSNKPASWHKANERRQQITLYISFVVLCTYLNSTLGSTKQPQVHLKLTPYQMAIVASTPLKTHTYTTQIVACWCIHRKAVIKSKTMKDSYIMVKPNKLQKCCVAFVV